MRKGAAFTFIPALMGDAFHVAQLARHTPSLIFETALETIGTAGAVFRTFEERKNTRALQKYAETYQGNRREEVDAQMKAYAIELDRRKLELEAEYRRERNKLDDRNFRERVAQSLARKFSEELLRISERLKTLEDAYSDELDESADELDALHEMQRRSLRDYNRLISEIL